MISRVSKRHEITFCYPSRREILFMKRFFVENCIRYARYTDKLELLWLKCSALHENYVTVNPNAKCRITINAIILLICEISWIFNVYILFPFFFNACIYVYAYSRCEMNFYFIFGSDDSSVKDVLTWKKGKKIQFW